MQQRDLSLQVVAIRNLLWVVPVNQGLNGLFNLLRLSRQSQFLLVHTLN